MTTTTTTTANEASSSSSSTHLETKACRCPSCGANKPAARLPKLVAWTVIPTMWAAIIGFGACLAILVPANLVLIPCWLVVGSSLGPLAREMLDPKCTGCGQVRGFSSSAPAAWKKSVVSASRASNVAGRATRPAHEGAMESGLV